MEPQIPNRAGRKSKKMAINSALAATCLLAVAPSDTGRSFIPASSSKRTVGLRIPQRHFSGLKNRQGEVNLDGTLLAAGSAVAILTFRSKSCKVFRARQVRHATSIVDLEVETTMKTQASTSSRIKGSRIVAVVGRDGVGKSKLCAALLEVSQGLVNPGPAFAEKRRLLEAETAENRRNFSCYNHVYSQAPDASGQITSRLHVIDTPGHVDRQPLVDKALDIAHGAVIVCSVKVDFDADAGRSFAAVEKAQKPSVIFVNGVDQADDIPAFEATIDSISTRLGVRPVVLFAPVHISNQTTGSLLLNVMEGTLCSTFGCSLDGGSVNPSTGHFKLDDPQLAQWAKQLRDQLIESLAAVDEEMMEAFMELEGDVPRILVEAALQRAVEKGKVIPLVAGSARNGLGVDALQEVLQTFISCGNGVDLIENRLGLCKPAFGVAFHQDSPFLGWVVAERRQGEERLLEVRVLDGTLKAGQDLKALSSAFQSGQVSTTFQASGLREHGLRGTLNASEQVGPGDLVLIQAPEGLPSPGEHCSILLSDAKRPFQAEAVPRILSNRGVPKGSYTYALQLDKMPPKEQKTLDLALEKLLHEEEGLQREYCKSAGQHLLSFHGPLHVELVRERLAEEFGILRLPLGRPRVQYQATVRAPCVATGKHSSAGKAHIRKGIEHKSGQKVDALLKVQLDIGLRGSGVVIKDPAGKIDPSRGGKVSEDAAAAFDASLREALRVAITTSGAGHEGTLALTDVEVTILAAEATSAEGFLEAAKEAIRTAVKEVQLRLLEPFVELRIEVQEHMADKVVVDLEKRRSCEVWGVEGGEPSVQVITAVAPMREVTDYPADLQKLTNGSGTFTSKPEGYREVEKLLEMQIMKGELGTTNTH